MKLKLGIALGQLNRLIQTYIAVSATTTGSYCNKEAYVSGLPLAHATVLSHASA